MCVFFQVEAREISLSPDILNTLRKLIADMNITPVPEVGFIRSLVSCLSVM